MEKNMNCWNGCMQEDIDAYVIMKQIMIGDEEVMFCHAWVISRSVEGGV